MRILWITENYYPGRGGMAQSCDRIVQALRTHSVQIDLVHFTGHLQSQPKIEMQFNGRYIAWPVGQDAPHAINCLWNWIEADSHANEWTHVVAFGGLLPMQAAPVFAAWLGLPLITFVRGNDFDAAL
ncbi:MAG: glycogen synthase, partial [Acidobacteria bacterium]